MKIKDILEKIYKSEKAAEQILKNGSLRLGVNPSNEIVEAFSPLRDKEACWTRIGRCIDECRFTISDGENTLSISYDVDSSD